MPDRFGILKRIISGRKAQSKTPTERPGLRAQKRAFDTFAKAATSLYNQALAGSAERSERIRDYEEMDSTPEIAKGLDIVSDNATTTSEEGTMLIINSEDERIVRELEELFNERLDIEFHLWNWIRNMAKYGDHFNLLDVVDKEGVLGAISLPVLEIEREEGFNGDPNSLRFRWNAQGSTVFENYQISHLRILGDDKFLPYGRSMLDSARRIWKQLQMAEDAMLIYRISRAPERRVFKIDVANIPPNQVEQYILQVRDKMTRSPLITESSGQLDLRYNPLSILEDFYLAVRGDRGSSIETLPGGCLVLDTKIKLLDGRTEELQTLIKEYNEGKENWVYSCNPETGKIVPGIVSWAGLTRKNAQVMKLTLDNKKEIVCTLDHKFPTWNKGMTEAQDLEVGDSMIPLSTRKLPISVNEKNKDYEQVFDNESKEWIFTHRLVITELCELNESNSTRWKIGTFTNDTVKQLVNKMGFKNWRDMKLRNHKIVKIEYLDERQDVGTLTIDSEEKYHDYHTFALAAEVLSSNSNQGDIDDINYIANKMFIALGIPKSYMTAEADMGNRANLAQEDINFARTIQRIQKIVVSELAKIALVHLYLRGFDEEDIYNFDISLTNPSTVMEMMQLDLMDKRFDVAIKMAETTLISDLYVQKNVLKFSDKEINETNQRLYDEARKKYLINNLEQQGDAAEPATDAEGNESSDDENRYGPNPMKVPDATGTKELPGVPKSPTEKEASVDDDEEIDEDDLDPGLIRRRVGVIKKDPFSRRIAEIMRYDRYMNKMFESLKIKKPTKRLNELLKS